MNESSTGDRGVVIRKAINQYTVAIDGRVVTCTLAPRLRKEFIYTGGAGSTHRAVKEVHRIEHVDPVAVGDCVQFTSTGENVGQIVEIAPRRNQLARRTAVPMPDAHPFEQVIAANVDQIIPVFAAARPTPKWNLLDRYLVSAESLDLPAVVCLTKLDLVQGENGSPDDGLETVAADYGKIGYRFVFTSTLNGSGIDEFKSALQGRISVLVGKSGVGKTSLLNAIQPGLGLKVNTVSQMTGKGRHTTSAVELYPLAGGGAIIDTPGIREFGLWDLEVDDLASFFPEMRPYIGRCRFGLGCRHEEEPGCALRKAVMAGQVSPRRYQSYLHLKVEGYFYDQGF